MYTACSVDSDSAAELSWPKKIQLQDGMIAMNTCFCGRHDCLAYADEDSLEVAMSCMHASVGGMIASGAYA
jgi:hypothetical protein